MKRYGGFQVLHGKAGSSAVSAVSDANNSSFVAVLVTSELRVPNTLCIYDTGGCSINSLLRTLFMQLDVFKRRRSQICDVIYFGGSQRLCKQLNLTFSYQKVPYYRQHKRFYKPAPSNVLCCSAKPCDSGKVRDVNKK
jgi:hypothetical protein